MIVPPDASVSVQKALQELNDRLTALEKTDTPDHSEAIRKLQTDVIRAARKLPFDEADAFGGSGSGHGFGLVPTPGGFPGSKRFLAEDGTWEPVLDGVLEAITPGTAGTSTAQATLSLKGSLAITSGLQADEALFRRYNAPGQTRWSFRNTANQSCTDSTWTRIDLDAENFKADVTHSNTSTPSAVTIVTPGLYILRASFAFDVNATGSRWIVISLNNSTPGSGGIALGNGQAIAATYGNNITAIAIRHLGVGDVLRVDAFQNSTSSLNLVASSADGNNYFAGVRIA